MNRPTVRIYTSIDSYIDRDMNDAEYEQYLKDISDYETLQEIETAKAQAKQVILDRLGLTADELKTILG
jgi:predicted esterase YcpF (UPF0227 family)